MGIKPGSENFEGEHNRVIEVSEVNQMDLSRIFTCINKDFISVQDFQEYSGLSYEICTRIIRQIKSISDSFHISCYVHRTDYYLYLMRNFNRTKWNIQSSTEQQYLDINDIMQVFDCGRSKAQGIIRSIKAISDTAKLKGKVTVADYEKWFNRLGGAK